MTCRPFVITQLVEYPKCSSESLFEIPLLLMSVIVRYGINKCHTSSFLSLNRGCANSLDLGPACLYRITRGEGAGAVSVIVCVELILDILSYENVA
jgi:hypothetical protein